MGTNAVEQLNMLDMPVPEYYATHIGRVEKMPGGCVRIYVCVIRGEHLEPVYSTIWPIENLLNRAGLVSVVGAAVLQEPATH